ncbi:MAG: NAD(P)H-hydrate dehydratase [Acholeplasmatales bacterium]|nr:MAG: NAD(P)H-hydrate dehydratase [Acholeplasmatales bacterium]
MHNQIVSAKTMRAMDAQTCKLHAMTGLALMERAGRAIFSKLSTTKPWCETRPLIVCGPGNNGGDGLVVAEALLLAGMDVSVCLVSEDQHLSTENRQVYERLKDRVHRIQRSEDIEWLKQQISCHDWILEALFGIGLTRPIEGVFKAVVALLNASGKSIVSIDLPAGLHTDSGQVLGMAVNATETWAIQAFKFGHFLADGKDYCGRLDCVDVGIVPVETPWLHQCLTEEDFLGRFPMRKQNVHKYHFGHVLVFGGDTSMMGAPVLSALASMRGGAGLASIVMPEQLRSAYTFSQPEIMIKTYCFEALPETIGELDEKELSIFGPGLGKKTPAYEQVIEHIMQQPRPLIIDADGLHYAKRWRSELLGKPYVVITPHGGEFNRFFDLSSRQDNDVIATVETLMQDTEAILVLKGPVTLVVRSGRACWIPFGSSVLAKAGTGDVLSGLIAARAAVNTSLFDATCEAVALHAQAGKCIERRHGREGLVASDLLAVMHTAFRSLHDGTE